MTRTLIVTSIAPPTPAMAALAQGAVAHGWDFFCIGDQKSPPDYDLPGCAFVSLPAQRQSGFELAALAPVGHYARKNIGYLLAIQAGSGLILETDDDNRPLPGFWLERSLATPGRRVTAAGWVNAYACFTDQPVWPRGFPLEHLHRAATSRLDEQDAVCLCPVQQGLANGDPDVDAVYRLTRGGSITFAARPPLILNERAWCPFNSQNTRWWRPVFPLLYLPFHCSFRMTDIWRSLVCQACLWPNGWRVAFHEPTVFQDRNAHDLLRDFADEVPGYLHNDRIVQAFAGLPLRSGPEHLFDNMRQCYEILIAMNLVGRAERELLAAWRRDLARAGWNAADR